MTSEKGAPAEMPSVEEIARLIDPMRFKSHEGLYDYSIRHGDNEDEARRCADWAHPLAEPTEKARAILGLFAPILAEKERAQFLATEDGEHNGNAPETDPWDVILEAQGHADHWRDRALAAEAALAAERERCATIVEDWVALGRPDEASAAIRANDTP